MRTRSNEAEDDSDTTDSNIKYEVSKTGKYFIVFRGQLNVAANISVRVDRSGGVTPPPPPPVGENPWGCTDAALSVADLIARVPTGANTLSLLPAGGLRYEQRSRVCNQQTGCANWERGHAVRGQRRRRREPRHHDDRRRRRHVQRELDERQQRQLPASRAAARSPARSTRRTHGTGAYEAKLTKTCIGTRDEAHAGHERTGHLDRARVRIPHRHGGADHARRRAGHEPVGLHGGRRSLRRSSCALPRGGRTRCPSSAAATRATGHARGRATRSPAARPGRP